MENILYNLESVCLFTKWCIHKFKRPVYQIKSHTAIHTHQLTHIHMCVNNVQIHFIYLVCVSFYSRYFANIQQYKFRPTFSNLSLDNENANFFFMSNKQMLTYCNCQNHFYRILKQFGNYFGYPKCTVYVFMKYYNKTGYFINLIIFVFIMIDVSQIYQFFHAHKRILKRSRLNTAIEH